MNTEQALKRFGLVPAETDLEEIRAILHAEIERERAGLAREVDLGYLCCAQLFAREEVEDCLRIWAAERSGMDLGTMVDGEMLLGAGLERTKAYLASLGGSAATGALEYINDLESRGWLDGFSHAAQMAYYRGYFRIP